jgi:hypothetical protein
LPTEASLLEIFIFLDVVAEFGLSSAMLEHDPMH